MHYPDSSYITYLRGQTEPNHIKLTPGGLANSANKSSSPSSLTFYSKPRPEELN